MIFHVDTYPYLKRERRTAGCSCSQESLEKTEETLSGSKSECLALSREKEVVEGKLAALREKGGEVRRSFEKKKCLIDWLILLMD